MKDGRILSHRHISAGDGFMIRKGRNLMSPNTDAFFDALCAAHIPGERNIRMSAHTTFRIGGTAAAAAYPEHTDALIRLLKLCRTYSMPCALVGCGSNLLWDDEPFEGCVIFTDRMRQIHAAENTLEAGAGAHLSAVCCAARDAGLSGLAFAYGIPGSVGGAVYMNAGAYDGEIGEITASVTCYDIRRAETVTLPAESCGFGYRTSRFQENRTNTVILSACFSLQKGCREEIRAAMEGYLARRREKQPLEFPSAGSAFRRYPGYYTAKLIDEAGLKGYRIGGAEVSVKHAGFIVNRGGATAADVRTLMAEIERRIYETNGIRIEPEIRTTADCMLGIPDGIS